MAQAVMEASQNECGVLSAECKISAGCEVLGAMLRVEKFFGNVRATPSRTTVRYSPLAIRHSLLAIRRSTFANRHSLPFSGEFTESKRRRCFLYP
jgi:hypothetical protein